MCKKDAEALSARGAASSYVASGRSAQTARQIVEMFLLVLMRFLHNFRCHVAFLRALRLQQLRLALTVPLTAPTHIIYFSGLKIEINKHTFRSPLAAYNFIFMSL